MKEDKEVDVKTIDQVCPRVTVLAKKVAIAKAWVFCRTEFDRDQAVRGGKSVVVWR